MADERIDGVLDIEVPACGNQITAITVNVDSFASPENKSASYYIVARDIQSAPPAGAIDFAVDGWGYVHSPTIDDIWEAIRELFFAMQHQPFAKEAQPARAKLEELAARHARVSARVKRARTAGSDK